MNNSQPIERRQHMYDLEHENLDVQSIFYTIQGEGPFCGTPAVFIRLAGCNLQCPACDTDYTSKRKWMSTDEIVHQVQSAPLFTSLNSSEDPCKLFRDGLVVITGGEPFRQDIALLVLKLVQRLGCYVQVETNGTLPPPISLSDHYFNSDIQERKFMYVVCSPKAGKVNQFTARVACAFKYVMNANSVDPNDGLPIHALDHRLGTLRVARPPERLKPHQIYLQPQDDYDTDKNKRNLNACVESCMKHGYTLQLQIHKLIGLE